MEMRLQMTLTGHYKAIIRRLDQYCKPKPHWVKATVITELTGWNSGKMLQARGNGSLVFKKEGNTYWYDLNQLNPLFIKNKTGDK